ncbi:MAG: hypothetical protein CVT88_06200 [Candidatus Altiarchaeales archaeon HGW-Altiarchaeales-1]|nr:MAG: hypothetical protein CVT88_06200 [Candidatus Altiarchaeales archaeon HGW-Altiarchaeales-1]PKP59616.1 MAG: hypothetical protein CVT89_01055 [Candidatus Altiarchaeales archaeon HGW-Altiarchaeales-2]
MTKIRPVERSFYAPILRLLENLGFTGISEVKPINTDRYLDILFEHEGNSYILEVKISAQKEDLRPALLGGIVQVYGYSLKYETKNMIVIVYPYDVKREGTIEEINKIAIERTCKCIFLTKEWDELVDLSVKESITQLKGKIEKKLLSAKNIETASGVLQSSIKSLSKLINKEYKDELLIKELVNFLTKDQGLFLSLSRTKSDKLLRNQAIDLISYILVNQILFYFLYSKKTGKVDEIKKIRTMSELNNYFNQIKEINFEPIFDIDVISKIPITGDITEHINNIITVLYPLGIEEMKQDIYGKLIGKCLPAETREVLASYYTKPASAKLLTNLTIKAWDEKVWDMACGSGTLLVESYNRKLQVHPNKNILTSEDKKDIHRDFLEEQLTGTDIMPFACHLTGLNLSAQNLSTDTKFVRVSNRNSLELFNLPIEVKEAYGDISNVMEHINRKQKTISDFKSPGDETTKKEYPAKMFKIDKVDTIVINPPFTRIQDIPEKLREEFLKSQVYKISGRRVGVWGHFMALSDKNLKIGGMIGAIIPINFLRGEDSKKIREYYLENYSFKYIIKPHRNTSFSEDSDFTDIMIIAKKIRHESNHELKIVSLRKPIDTYTGPDIESIVRELETVREKEKETGDFSIIKVMQSELLMAKENLMSFIFTENLTNKKKIEYVLEKLKLSNKTKKLEKDIILEGFHASPKGISQILFINNPLSESRVKRAHLVLDGDKDKSVDFKIKNKREKYSIDKIYLKKSVRTITGIKNLYVKDKIDYMIRAKPEDIQEIIDSSKYKGKDISWENINKEINKKESHILIPNRFRFNSDETYVTAICCDEKIIAPHSFEVLPYIGKEEAKILCLYMNSILYWIQLLKIKKETTGSWMGVSQSDLVLMDIIDSEKLKDSEKKELMELLDELEDLEFDPIHVQIRDKKDYRLKLDKTILKVAGFNENDLNKIIEDIYPVILDEIC